MASKSSQKSSKKRKPRTPKSTVPTHRPLTYKVSDHNNWKQVLDTQGFVVLENIVSPEQKEVATELFKKDLQYISPNFDWNDNETWTSNNAPLVWGKSSAVYCGFGHCDSNWFLRINSQTKDAFSHVYGTTELVASFDGFSLFLSDKQKSKSWLHQDQRISDTRYSIQGVLNLMPCDELDAGFICVPRSHLEYKAPIQYTDWVMLPKESEYQKKAVKILTPERCLILFHSKLIHANTSMARRHPNQTHINRLSAYIAFVPKQRQPREIYNQRVAGYLDGITCSHWADRYEVKKIPFHIRNKFKGFNTIVPTTTEDGKIPPERLALF